MYTPMTVYTTNTTRMRLRGLERTRIVTLSVIFQSYRIVSMTDTSRPTIFITMYLLYIIKRRTI